LAPARYSSQTATVPTAAAVRRATTKTSVGFVANALETPARPPNHTSKTTCSRYV
jgi:hypothetical protein